MYDFQVQDAKNFMIENGIKCEKRFFEPTNFFNRRYERSLESAYKLKQTIQSAQCYLSCIHELIAGNLELHNLLGNKSKTIFLFPAKPLNLNLSEWISYEKSISQMYRDINSNNTDLKASAIEKIFDEAIMNIPQDKTVICFKSAYVPKQENSDSFEKAVIEMSSDGKDTGNFGIACCGLWYEWFAFKPAKIDTEKLKSFKKLYLANPVNVKVTFA